MKSAVIETQRNNVRMKVDVYEHLAKTFLDKNIKKKPSKKKIFVIVSSVIFAAMLISFVGVSLFFKMETFSKSIIIIQDKAPLVIEYNFANIGDPKTRSLSYNLDNLDLSQYKSLSLSMRTKEVSSIGSTIQVQIKNSVLEKDAVYISNINDTWQVFLIDLERFERIDDWSSIDSLTFVIDEWNVDNKVDSLIIDEVKFVSE